ncbi:hypothetical protein TNIN_93531 [Trichonephila inaurata madagascariensis]|uniref:Uncharacterized protein n=1 Tax=Trichonephila inaurata madagascariensis TaxID=2747483 RepID=A0A8X6WUV7_9ARAC|nr:hypothetical protein TNIN_93531 [Trichonephila inaurata madagascariensis]
MICSVILLKIKRKDRTRKAVHLNTWRTASIIFGYSTSSFWRCALSVLSILVRSISRCFNWLLCFVTSLLKSRLSELAFLLVL